MPLPVLVHTQYLLGDVHGLWTASPASLQGLLDRGARELGGETLLIQKRHSFLTTPGLAAYAPPVDHLRTFTLFRGAFSVVVRLLDQSGRVWWLTVTETGLLGFTDTLPAINVLLATVDVYWLEIRSPDLTTWFVYPGLTGLILTQDSVPLVGTGTTETVQLRDGNGLPWYPVVSDTGLAGASSTGTATLAGGPIHDHALQRVEPESMTINVPRPVTGAPERYALHSSGVLILHPVPDGPYELRHLYFADDTLLLPDAAAWLLPLYASGLVLRQRGRVQAAGMMQAMAAQEAMLFSANISPYSRDSSDLYPMPRRG